MKVTAAIVAAMGIALLGGFGARSAGAVPVDKDCLYANFEGGETGVVTVCGVVPGSTGTVTVYLHTDVVGIVALCATRPDGSTACGALAPEVSGFVAGCSSYSFAMGLSEIADVPQRVELFTPNFVVSLASGDLVSKPHHPDINAVRRVCGWNR